MDQSETDFDYANKPVRGSSSRGASTLFDAKRCGTTVAPQTLAAVCASILLITSGCASLQSQKKAEAKQAQKHEQLKDRIEELERQNGRLTTRIEQLEDDIFLLQDRVEAHRLALKRQRQKARNRQRRRSDRGSSRNKARRPEPPPRTSYEPRRDNSGPSGTWIELSPNQSGATPQSSSSRTTRGSTENSSNRTRGNREPASQNQQASATSPSESNESTSDSAPDERTGPDETIVITNEDFEKYSDAASGSAGSSATANEASRTADSADDPQPQPRVTDQKLKTSSESNKSAESTPSTNEPHSELKGKSGLDLYKASLSLYRQGDYGVAKGGFKQFMNQDPRHDYQDNGLYWIGECEFGLGRHKKAISLFKQVIDEHPGGNKVPDAMLKMALAYRELGQTERARQLLKKVASQYPNTNVGDLAERKLR